MAILTGDGATTNRAGRIEIATDAEAFAGADVDHAITPDQLLAVVGQGVAAVAGGLIYKGLFDATAQLPDLSFAVQGHFYKIGTAGQAFGQSWSVNDMLLINEDMGGVIDNGKIDKIDNGESLAQLDDLVDVVIANPAEGQYLYYDGADWRNAIPSSDDIISDHAAVNYIGLGTDTITVHLSGIDTELNNRADTVNAQAVVNGSVTIDGSHIDTNTAATEYTAADATLDAHFAGIDTKFGALDLQCLTDVTLSGTLTDGEILRYNGAEWVDTTLTSDDVNSDHAAANYTAADGTVTGHLSGIDTELGALDTKVDDLTIDDLVGVNLTGTLSDGEILRHNGAEWVDARLSTDDVDSDHAAANYTAADATATGHISGIDTELGALDGKIDALTLDDLVGVNLTGTLSDGEILRHNGAEWVDTRLSSDDVDADHQGVNYTGVDNTVTGQLAGIDNELPNKADTINSVAVVAGAVTLDGDDIVAPHAATNYTGLNTDNITTHLSGIDSQLGDIDLSINNIQAQNNNIVLDADDLASDFLAVNYTGLATDTVKTHLSGIDTELNNRADTVNSVAVVNGAVTIDSDDIVGVHEGVNYSAVNTDTISAHLAAIDTDLGTLDTKIDNLSLNPLTDVTISGTLTDGETLRYDAGASQWVDSRLSSDDIDSDHAAVNFTAGDATVTGHLSGLDAELPNKADTVNGVAVAAGSVTIDSDDIVGTHTGVNYTGLNTDTITTHFNLVDTKLGSIDGVIANLDLNDLGSLNLSGTLSAGEVMRYDGAEWVDARLSSDDVDSDHAAANYTAADATVTGHLSGLDTELENKADTVNGVAVVAGDVTIASDDIVGEHTGVNYTGANTDSVTTHLSGIDTELGALDTKIDNLSLNPLADVTISGTLTDGETLRYDANASQWVDRRLGSDDIDSEHAATNYTAADGTMTGHLSGIDAELGSVATSINNIQAQNNNIALDADDLPADLLAVNYTGIATDSVKTHLSGIDTELNNRADTVNAVAVVNGAVTIGSDDIVGERAGTNYTALNTDTITTHLSGIDAALGSLELDDLTDVSLTGTLSQGEVLRWDGAAWADATLTSNDVDSDHAAANYTAADDTVTGHLSGLDTELENKADTVNGIAVANGDVTIGSDDIVAERAGTNYTALITDTITTHLSAIDTELGALPSDLGDLTSVSLTGTLSVGEVLRYDGADWVDATLSTDDVTTDRAGVQYSANQGASITDHLAAIDTEFNQRANQVNSVAAINGSVTIDADDIISDYLATNYTATNLQTIRVHLSGIDTKLGSLPTDLGDLSSVALTGTLSAGEVLKYDGADWVDATLSSDEISGDRAGTNYTANSGDSVTTHLSAIDTALGLAVGNASIEDLNDVTLGTLTAGEVLRWSGAEWVDAQLDYSDLSGTPAIPESSDDIDSDHAATNYTAADATVTGHLSGLDTELATFATSVNTIAAVNGDVTLGSDDIVGERTGTNYTAANTDTITTHLSAIDTKLGTNATAISQLDLGDLTSIALTGTLSAGEVLRYDGADWVDATLSYNDLSDTPVIPEDSDDITGVHTGVNYTAANTATVTQHLAAIDNKIGTLEGAGSVDDISVAATLVRGRLYQATNATDVTYTLPASADSEEGDKIRLYRSQAAGLVTIQQNGGDAGTIIRTAEGFASSFTVNLQGEYVEVVYDADDTVWRVVQERAAYIEATVTTTSDPYTVTRTNALFELDAAGTTRINVTLPAYSKLKSGDHFRFVVNADREVELNVAAADSGTVDFIQAGSNNGDQIVLNALAGQPFEVKCLSNGGTDEFIVESVLGTASKYDVGEAANNIVQLDANGKLPAIDGSQLTNIAGGGGGGLNFDRKAINFTATVNYHYSVSTATTAVTMTLPAISGVGDGDQVRIYFRERGATNDITINVAAASGDLINGLGSFTLDVQYESITLVANTTDAIWEVI
jgi:hypothetical protein